MTAGNSALWTLNVSGASGNPVISKADGTIYVGGNPLRAVGRNGQLKWSYQQQDCSAGLSNLSLGDDGVVYGHACNNFYAINPDGTQKWKKLAINNNMNTSVISDEGKVFVRDSNGSTLYALSQVDGSVIWSKYFNDFRLIYADSVLYVNEYYQEKVSALNVSNGESIWTYSANNNSFSISSITASGLILATVQTNYGSQLEAIDITSGAKVWSYDPSEVSKTDYASIWAPTIGADGTIYLSGEGNMQALNPDGTLRWVRYSDEHYDRTGFTYLMPGGRLYHNYYGYLKVSSNGLEDGPWPYPYYGDYSNRRVTDGKVRGPLDSPLGVAAVPTVDGRITVSWDAVEYASSYELAISNNPNQFVYSESSAITTHTYTPGGPETFYFKVRAIDNSGYQTKYSTYSAVVDAAALLPATGSFDQLAADNGQVHLNITPLDYATYYTVRHSPAPIMPTTNSLISGVTQTISSGVYTSVASPYMTTYNFIVAGCNYSGCGAYSSLVSTAAMGHLTAGPPQTPQLMHAVANDDGSVSVSWYTHNSDSYRLYWDTDLNQLGTSSVAEFQSLTGNYSYTHRVLENLSANNTYFSLESYNVFGTSTQVTPISTVPRLPMAVANLSGQYVSSDTTSPVHLSWQASPGSLDYQVYSKLGSSNQSFSLTAVVQGTSYQTYDNGSEDFKVRARNYLGYGPYSNIVRVGSDSNMPVGTTWTDPYYGVEMMRISSGIFTMGSPSYETDRDVDEGPQHTVMISKDFYLGKYEVTQGQWEAVMGGTNSWPADSPSTAYGASTSHPAYNISWNDINAVDGFLDKINQAVGCDTSQLTTDETRYHPHNVPAAVIDCQQNQNGNTLRELVQHLDIILVMMKHIQTSPIMVGIKIILVLLAGRLGRRAKITGVCMTCTVMFLNGLMIGTVVISPQAQLIQLDQIVERLGYSEVVLGTQTIGSCAPPIVIMIFLPIVILT